MENLHDHRFSGTKAQYRYDSTWFPSNQFRTKFLRMICEEYTPLYDTATKAVLLDALQKFGIRAHPTISKAVVDIIRVRKRVNQSLTRAPSHVRVPNFYNYEISSTAIQNTTTSTTSSITNCHTRSCERKRSTTSRTTHTKIRRGLPSCLLYRHTFRRLFKILSDVDDTLQCSGGHFPAGCDTKFPRKAIYPGAFAFYRELDMGLEAPSEKVNDSGVSYLPRFYSNLSFRPRNPSDR